MGSVEAAASVSGSSTSRSSVRALEARRVVRVGDQQLRLRVRQAMVDRLLAVEDRHREQDRAELPDAEEDRSGLGRRRQHDGDAVTAPDAAIGERMRRLVREILELAPGQLPRRAVEALPDHRPLVARMLVADVGGDVVARRHLPPVRGADLLVARRAHAYSHSASTSHRRGRVDRRPISQRAPVGLAGRARSPALHASHREHRTPRRPARPHPREQRCHRALRAVEGKRGGRSRGLLVSSTDGR